MTCDTLVKLFSSSFSLHNWIDGLKMTGVGHNTHPDIFIGCPVIKNFITLVNDRKILRLAVGALPLLEMKTTLIWRLEEVLIRDHFLDEGN